MSHSPLRPARSLPTLALLSAVLGAAAFGVFTPSVAHAGDDDACTTKKFHYPAVEKACHDGGRKAAKALMMEAVKKARAAKPELSDLKCTGCHVDMKDFKLKDNAVNDLKPWI